MTMNRVIKIFTLLSLLCPVLASSSSVNCDYNHLKKLTIELKTTTSTPTNNFDYAYDLNFKNDTINPNFKIYINSDLCKFFKTNKNKIGFFMQTKTKTKTKTKTQTKR